MKINHAPSTLFTAIIFGCAIVFLLMKGANLLKQQFHLQPDTPDTASEVQIRQDYVLIPAQPNKHEAQSFSTDSFTRSKKLSGHNEAEEGFTVQQ